MQLPSFVAADIDVQLKDVNNIKSIPELIEHNASYNPNHPFCLQAQKHSHDRNAPPQLISISHLQLKQAILQCQSRLSKILDALRIAKPVSVGDDGKSPPIALYVESDVGLLIHLFSFLGLGIPVLLVSARLSPTAINHLLVTTRAGALIVSPSLKNNASEALSMYSKEEDQPALYMQDSYHSLLVPSSNLESVDGGEGSICHLGHYVEEHDRNVLILHSSGTTGLPKPIYQSHRWLLSFATCHEFSPDAEKLSLSLSTLPLYHGYGLVSPALSLGIGKTLCIPPPSVIPTGVFIRDLLDFSKSRSLISVPSILEEMCLLPQAQGIETLATLDFVAFGGGLLKSSVGEKLTAGNVKVLNHYGSTESGPIAPLFVPTTPYDWHYFRLRKDINMRLEHGPLLEDGLQSFLLITHPPGWTTPFIFQDQLIANPANPDSDFSAIGRSDDLIVLANGEKVTPRILETMLFENELVNAAVAFGSGQFELGVIVQPSSHTRVADHDLFKESIWPIISKAGGQMDAHARISSKEAILVVPFDAIFPRSDKGSIMRKEVYQMFGTEIESVYENLENSLTGAGTVCLDMDNLEEEIKNMIQNRLTWRLKAEEWTVNDDFFEMGMDSLQVIQLHRLILSSMPATSTMRTSKKRITRDLIYRNPTVRELSSALKISNEQLSNDISIKDLVQQFCVKDSNIRQALPNGAVVVMTGGTGSLGSHLLAHLATLPSVSRIICLNRSNGTQDAETRQLNALHLKSIDLDSKSWSKVEVLETDTALPLLGLSMIDYTRIQNMVTHVLHNAWPMDFKRKLPSFKAQFRALQNLLALARDTHSVRLSLQPRLLFVSSIAVVGRYPLVMNQTMVPEMYMTTEKCTNDIGYAKAKLVCERILERAASDFSTEIDVSYVRIGQMSGSKKTGSWNTDEHIAALFKSAQNLGHLPYLKGTLSWTPVDLAAEIVSELLLSTRKTHVAYHLENHIRQSWHDVLTTVAPELGLPMGDFIPFHQWLDMACALPDESKVDVPVKKLETFFREDFEHMASGSIVLDTKNAREASPTLHNLGTIHDDLLLAYIRQWKHAGYLS